MKHKIRSLSKIKKAGISLLTIAALVPATRADSTTAAASAAVPAPAPATLIPSLSWQKPAWITDLSAGAKESYDDNVLLVSGNGLQPQESWITTFSAKMGLNFAPLLPNQDYLKTLTFVYAPDFNFYHDAPQESYNAHKIGDSVRASAGNFSFSLDNAFLYNDGNDVAPIYALNQAANTDDKFRNFYAQAVPRERRNQIQDRGTIAFQYNVGQFFLRPTASLIYYNLNTIFHNTSAGSGFVGYQNWPGRYDANGGADVGYQLTPAFAVMLGYRYGHQFQQQFDPSISADQHYATSDYQRALVGLEGNPVKWLNIKMSAGPDFRHYNSMAPVNSFNPLFGFAEASVTATITKNQSLSFYTKEWEWVASTGLVPYYDSTYTLNYHWNASRHWSFDLGGKVLHATFSSGNDTTGSAPSLRDDIQYTVALGITYNFNANLSASVNYNYDIGRNLDNLPSTLFPSYRNFDHNLVSLGVQYKF